MDFIPSFTIFFIVSSFECSQLPGISSARQPIWRSSPGGCFGSIFAAKASSKHSSCGGDAWRRPAGGLALSNIGKIGIYGRLLFAKLVNINQNSLGFIGRYLCIIYTYIYYIYWYNKYGMIIVWDGMSINSWCGLYIFFLSGGTTLQDLSRIVVLRLKWEVSCRSHQDLWFSSQSSDAPQMEIWVKAVLDGKQIIRSGIAVVQMDPIFRVKGM